ncbi:MAG: hypothetical protein AAB317_03980 [Nitrospirota bacterium]
MKLSQCLFLFLVGLIQVGCATILHPDRHRVHVDTDPRDAQITGNYSSQEETSPALVTIKKGRNVYLDLSKEGYYPLSVQLEKSVQPSFWANILMPIGFFIDWQTGNMWHYQDRIFVKLEKKAEGDLAADTGNTERNPRPPAQRASSKPKFEEVNLSGPRVGFTHFTKGLRKQILEEEGVEVRSLVAQFGWHFEKTISMNEEGPMLVFTLAPLLGGVDHNISLTTVSGLVGIRGASGMEISMGPTWFEDETAVTYAVGTHVRSGHLKIPFNLSVTPLQEGTSITFLTGFSW